MAVSTLANEMKLELTLRDPRAVEIVQHMPIERRDDLIERYIILGEMVVSHASIGTRKETVEEFFAPLRNDIETIREQLKVIVPTIATPSKKGQITQETIFNSLQEHFLDDTFEDVSTIGKYIDILATTSDSTPILIEVKDYSGTVPFQEVTKFWRDIERRGTRYGVFISMRSPIAKCSGCISVKDESSGTALFVNDSELNWSGHILAYHIVRRLAGIESAVKKESQGEDICKIITKVHSSILELQKNTASINKIEDIADSLRRTCKNKLDELVDLSGTLRRNVDEEIKSIIEDLGRVETK